jgi:hypothetical protein
MEKSRNEEPVNNMFSNCSFQDSVVVGIAKEGSTVCYGHEKAHAKKQSDSDLQGKKAVMEYVGRLKPAVKEQYRDQYDNIWEGILELSQVKAVIYDKGKQQDTTFNRNLLAKIVHQVDELYMPIYNNAQKATYLEPEKGADHSIRHKLGESPDKPIKKAIEDFMKDKLQ